jgi:hypothetical protein
MNPDLLMLCIAVFFLIGAEVYRRKRGAMPFGRVGAIMWVSAAVWIVLWGISLSKG